MKNRNKNLSKSVINPKVNFYNFERKFELVKDRRHVPSSINSPVAVGHSNESSSINLKDDLDDTKATKALRKGLINMEELGLRYSMNQKGKRRDSMLEFHGIIDRENLHIVNQILNLKGDYGEDQVEKLKEMLLGHESKKKHKTLDPQQAESITRKITLNRTKQNTFKKNAHKNKSASAVGETDEFIRQFQMTNIYNDISFQQRFELGMQKLVAQRLQEELLHGTEKITNQKTLKKSKEQKQDTEKQDDDDNVLEHDYAFFNHFKIEVMLTIKCIVVSCPKFRGRKFVVKKLTDDVLELQKFVDEHYHGIHEQRQFFNLDQQIGYLDLVKPWMDLPPQVPLQNFVNCYGLIKIKQYFYMITDFIQDSFEAKNETLEKDSINDDGNEVRASRKPSQMQIYGARMAYSINVYGFIKQMNLGNLGNLATIPKDYVNFIFKYILQVSRSFAHIHEHDMVHGNFKLSKVIAQRQTNSTDIGTVRFIIVNLEPWVIQKMQKDKLKKYKKVLKSRGLTMTEKEFIKIVQIQDLYAFANSLLEIMVGKFQEIIEKKHCCHEDKPKSSRNSPKRKVHQAKTSPDVLSIPTRSGLRSYSQNSNESQRSSQFSQMKRHRTVKITGEITKTNEEMSDQDLEKLLMKVMNSEVSIDSLSLNWVKTPFIKALYKIIKMSISPFGDQNRYDEFDTTKIFKEIHMIAQECYHLLTNSDPLKENYDQTLSDLVIKTQNHDRLKSSIHNNQGLMMFLSVSEKSNPEMRIKTLNYIKDCFQRAIKLSENNYSALLNNELLKWYVGDIKDEEILQFLNGKFKRKDPASARIMFCIFQERIQGFKMMDSQKLQIVQKIKQMKNLTELAQYLLQNYEFSHANALCNNDVFGHANFECFQDGVYKKQKINKIIEPLKDFNLNMLFLSSNENFMGAIGKHKFAVYDTKNGSLIHQAVMPTISDHEFLATHQTQDSFQCSSDANSQRLEFESVIDSEEFLKTSFSGENEGGSESKKEEGLDNYLDSSQINVVSSQIVKPTMQRNINMTTNSFPKSTADFSDEQTRFIQGSLNSGDPIKVINQEVLNESGQNSDPEVTITRQSVRELSKLRVSQIFVNATPQDIKPEEDQILMKSPVAPEKSSKRTKPKSRRITLQANTPVELQDQPHSHIDLLSKFKDQLNERHEMLDLIPPDWMACIRNNGKTLAFFDRAQQVRNKKFQYQENQCEIMFIVTYSNRGQTVYIDLWKTCQKEEVLDFSLDENNPSFSTICIQTKSLCFYTVDFITNTTRKFGNQNLMNASIFRNLNKKHLWEQVKQFIQHQEFLGHKVFLPKYNKEILVVRMKDTDLIKIWSISIQRFVRQFTLTNEQMYFKDLEEEEAERFKEVVPDESKNTKQDKIIWENALNFQEKLSSNKTKLGKFMQGYEVAYSDRDEYNKFCVNKRISHMKSVQPTLQSHQTSIQINADEELYADNRPRVKHLVLSDQGTMLACLVNNKIFIQVINVVNSDDPQSHHEQFQPFPTLPIYFDNDYLVSLPISVKPPELPLERTGCDQFLVNIETYEQEKRELYHERQKKRKVPYKIVRVSKLPVQLFEKTAKSWITVQRPGLNSYMKNERMIEIAQMVNLILQQPELLHQCQFKPKVKLRRIEECIEMIRYIQVRDRVNCEIKSLLGLTILLKMDQFVFQRSSEYVKSFITTSVNDNNYVAIFVNRKVQIYNSVTAEFLFDVNYPNAGYFCQKGLDYQQFYLFDNEQIIAFQNSKDQIQFLNIQANIEAKIVEQKQKKVKDVVIKIEPMIGLEIDIKNEFGAPLEEKVEDKKSDGSDDNNEEDQCKSANLRVDYPIEKIFASTNMGAQSYLTLVSKLRFSIYKVQDDSQGSVDITPIWDNDYRFNKELRVMGQITAIDFEQYCQTFITCSQSGVIILWDFQEKKIMRRVMTKEPLQLIKSFIFDRKTIAYNQSKQKVLLINLKQLVYGEEPQQEEQKEKTPLPQEDFQVAGSTVSSIRGSMKGQSLLSAPKPAQKTSIKATQSSVNTTNRGGAVKQIALRNITMEPPAPKLEIDCIESETFHIDVSHPEKGDVIQIEYDRSESFMVLIFANKYVEVHDIKEFSKTKKVMEFGPFKCHQLFVDEHCTYLAVLDCGQHRIFYHFFQWEFQVTKLERPKKPDVKKVNELQSKLESNLGTKILDAMSINPFAKKKTPDGHLNKSTACNIF